MGGGRSSDMSTPGTPATPAMQTSSSLSAAGAAPSSYGQVAGMSAVASGAGRSPAASGVLQVAAGSGATSGLVDAHSGEFVSFCQQRRHNVCRLDLFHFPISCFHSFMVLSGQILRPFCGYDLRHGWKIQPLQDLNLVPSVSQLYGL